MYKFTAGMFTAFLINFFLRSRGNAVPRVVTGPSRLEFFAKDDYKHVAFSTRVDAMSVLEGLDALIMKYGYATIEDFYDLIDQEASMESSKWGWNSALFYKVAVKRTAVGFQIIFPEPELVA